MNELRQEHERQSFERSQEAEERVEEVFREKDAEMEKLNDKWRQEMTAKNNRIKELERQTQRDRVIGEQAEQIKAQVE